jgi:hypothetical protein
MYDSDRPTVSFVGGRIGSVKPIPPDSVRLNVP